MKAALLAALATFVVLALLVAPWFIAGYILYGGVLAFHAVAYVGLILVAAPVVVALIVLSERSPRGNRYRALV